MTDLMAQGTNLAILGIGTVFVFLTILVGATALMSVLAAKLEHAPAAPAEPVEQGGQDEQDQSVLAAAVTAVAAYRKQHIDRSE